MSKRVHVLALALAGLLSSALVIAQRPAPGRTTALTAADIIEIQQLAVRYSYALDTGASDGQMFAALYAPGGAFISATRGRMEGDALRSLGRGRDPMYPRRFITNHVIESRPEGVVGRAYVVEVDLPTDGSVGGQLTSTGGRYEDVYQKTAAGWRFQTRRFIPSHAAFRPAPPPGTPAPAAAPSAASQAPDLAPPIAPRADSSTSSAATANTTAPAPRKATALSPTDYIEIQQLVDRYAYALDSGAADGTGSNYAALFTSDGAFVGPGIPDQTVGSDKLAALARIPAGSRTRRGVNYVSHFMTNHLIEPSPEGALGKVYLLVLNFGDTGQPHSISMGGHYEDTYTRTAQGWRFKKREFFRGKVGGTAGTQWMPSMIPIRPAAKETRFTNGSTLTAMDYIEIAKVVAGYGYGLDTGADDGYAYADLFTTNGSLFGRPRTRDERRALTVREPHGPEFIRHFLTNVLIEPTPEGARGNQYLAVIDVGEGGGPSSLFLGGRYEDMYVKTPQGWRFASRNLTRANAPVTPQTAAAPPPGSAAR